MKRMTKKLYGILILSMLATSAHAGWLSNLGQRIVNGAVNTVQTNISGKVNRTIDNAMDGKLAPQQKNSKSPGNNIDGYSVVPTPGVSAGGTAIVETQGSTYRGATGKIIPSTGKYEQIDLGITKFTGEEIYSNLLKIGETKKEINEFLEPGYYFICVTPGSRTEPIGFLYDREREGIGFGYGIEVRQKIRNNGQEAMLLGKHEIKYVVQVLPNTQGHIEVTLVNNPKLSGSGEISIYKIPGPTLK